MSMSHDAIGAVRSGLVRHRRFAAETHCRRTFRGRVRSIDGGTGTPQLRAAQSRRVAAILLDLSEVNFIDAHSIGLIVAAWASAKDHGRVLCVVGLHGMPARLFSMLGLERLSRDPASDIDGGGDPHARP